MHMTALLLIYRTPAPPSSFAAALIFKELILQAGVVFTCCLPQLVSVCCRIPHNSSYRVRADSKQSLHALEAGGAPSTEHYVERHYYEER